MEFYVKDILYYGQIHTIADAVHKKGNDATSEQKTHNGGTVLVEEHAFRSSALSGLWRMESYVNDSNDDGCDGVWFFMHENMTKQKMTEVLKTAKGYQHFSKDLHCIGRYDWCWLYHCDKAGKKITAKFENMEGDLPSLFQMGSNFIMITEENVHEFLKNIKSVKTIEDMEKFDFSKTLSMAVEGDSGIFGGLVFENEKLVGICVAEDPMHGVNFATLTAKVLEN